MLCLWCSLTRKLHHRHNELHLVSPSTFSKQVHRNYTAVPPRGYCELCEAIQSSPLMPVAHYSRSQRHKSRMECLRDNIPGHASAWWKPSLRTLEAWRLLCCGDLLGPHACPCLLPGSQVFSLSAAAMTAHKVSRSDTFVASITPQRPTHQFNGFGACFLSVVTNHPSERFSVFVLKENSQQERDHSG